MTRLDSDSSSAPAGVASNILDQESKDRSGSRNRPPGSPAPKAIVEPLRKRLDLSQFQQLIQDVTSGASIDEIIASLTEHGVPAKRNLSKLRELFSQNTFYKARPQYVAALGQLFWEHILSTIREDQRILDLTLLIVPDEVQSATAATAHSNDDALRAALMNSKLILDDKRLLQLAALYAEEKRFRFIDTWHRTGASGWETASPPSRPEPEQHLASHQEKSFEVVHLAAESPAEPEPELQPAIAARPSALSPSASANDGSRPSPVGSNAPQLAVPYQSAHSAVELAINTATSLSSEVLAVTSHDPSLVHGSLSSLRDWAERLRRLAGLVDHVVALVEAAREALLHDYDRLALWCSDYGESLSAALRDAVHEIDGINELSDAASDFQQQSEEVIARLRVRHNQITAERALVDDLLQQLPELEAAPLSQQLAVICRRLDVGALVELHERARETLQRVQRADKQRQLAERMRQLHDGIMQLADAKKRERCLARLTALEAKDLLIADFAGIEESLLALEDMLPAGFIPMAERVVEASSETARVPDFTITHSFFSDARMGGRTRPPLIIPPEPKPLMIPVCLEFRERTSTPLSLTVQLSGEGTLFKGHGAIHRTPEQAIEVPAGADRHEMVLRLALPENVRKRLNERKSQLSVLVVVGNQSRELTWDSHFLRPDSKYTPKNPLAITSPSLEDINRLRVGVETRLKDIQQWVEQGRGHVYLAAPRRFGKTSVARYCADAYSQSTEIALVRADCAKTQHGKRGEILKLVVRSLAKRLDVFDEQIEHLEHWADRDSDWEIFERIIDGQRKNASDRKFSRIVVLIDEAQMLFARPATATAYEFADRLKSSLEHMSRQSDNMVPLHIGFLGRLNLRHLFGQNLRDTFLPPSESVTELREDEVTEVLRSINTEICWTVDSRTRLREYGINLVFLRDLFGTVCKTLAEEHRLFIVRGDVDAAIERLRNDEVGQYLRDPLNRADDTNNWMPVRGYPVAVAIATATKSDEYVEMHRVAERLSQLANSDPMSVELIRRVLSDEEINDIIERQKGSDGIRIKAEPLRVFLRNQRPSEMDLRSCLAELLLPEFDIPTGAVRVDHGGQAELFRGTVDGADVAIRKLFPDANPVRFQREVVALKKIGQQRAPGQQAYQSLPELVRWGRCSDGRLALACKWIDGVNLRQHLTRCRPGGLPAHLVRTIGYQVASALAIIHDSELAHRDVKPDNVMLSIQGVAVLIDFGLAREMTTSGSASQVGTNLYVPFAGQGQSTGDLFAFTRMLCVLLSGDETEPAVNTGLQVATQLWGNEVAALLKRALRSDIKDRGSAGELARALTPRDANPSEFEHIRQQLPRLFASSNTAPVRQSLNAAISYADGVEDPNLRLVTAATLFVELVECVRKRHYATPLWRSMGELLADPVELKELGFSLTEAALAEFRAVNLLRNGFGHWSSLPEKIRNAENRLGKGSKLHTAVQRALATVAEVLFVGKDSVEQRQLIADIGKSVLSRAAK